MKRLLLAALAAALPLLGMAAGNDVLMNQRNAADTATLSRVLAHPPGGQNGILGFNGSTVLPQFFVMGSGLNLSGGTLSAPPPDWSAIPGKPALSTVATTGAYGDLSGRPTLFSGAYANLTGIPATFPPGAHTQAWSTITSTPTTLAGYGITDGITLSSLTTALGSYATTAALTSGLAGKFNIPTGTTAQYIRGDGSLATLPASGTGTVTSIAAGTGLSGGTITTTGTISMPNVGTAGTYASVTTDAQGRVTAGTPITINDAPGRTLVTATSATGFQISATRVAQACYEGSFSTTSTIGGPSSATVFLETADTNSTTPSDWTIRAQQTYSNTITLAVVLNQVQGNNWSMCRYIPAGKFVRLRTGNVTGTASASLNTTQQEVLQ